MDARAIRAMRPEERAGHKINQKMKELDKLKGKLASEIHSCHCRVTQAETEREKAEHATRSVSAELARVRDRLNRSEAMLRSLGHTPDE